MKCFSYEKSPKGSRLCVCGMCVACAYLGSRVSPQVQKLTGLKGTYR